MSDGLPYEAAQMMAEKSARTMSPIARQILMGELEGLEMVTALNRGIAGLIKLAFWMGHAYATNGGKSDE